MGQNSISFYVTSEEIQKLTTYGFYFDDFEISDNDPEILNNNETEALSEVIILPNTFDSSLSMHGISEDNAAISMYDVQGRKLKFSLESVNNDYFIVGLDALTSGIYFIKKRIRPEKKA